MPVGMEMISHQLQDFVEQLALADVPPNVCNQYSHDHGPNAIRRSNLLLYLEEMTCRMPEVLLVGEAAGYRGGRQTGVPFTSEQILLRGVDEVGMFGCSHGYRKADEHGRMWTEATATMVWRVLAELRAVPLLWNALPFHPFRPGDELSNRCPTREELGIGQPFLQDMMRLFRVRTVIAVGNTADQSLSALGVTHQKVRHPAHGGQTQFMSGLRRLL